jgi:hypothetical protein
LGVVLPLVEERYFKQQDIAPVKGVYNQCNEQKRSS